MRKLVLGAALSSLSGSAILQKQDQSQIEASRFAALAAVRRELYHRDSETSEDAVAAAKSAIKRELAEHADGNHSRTAEIAEQSEGAQAGYGIQESDIKKNIGIEEPMQMLQEAQEPVAGVTPGNRYYCPQRCDEYRGGADAEMPLVAMVWEITARTLGSEVANESDNVPPVPHVSNLLKKVGENLLTKEHLLTKKGDKRFSLAEAEYSLKTSPTITTIQNLPPTDSSDRSDGSKAATVCYPVYSSAGSNAGSNTGSDSNAGSDARADFARTDGTICVQQREEQVQKLQHPESEEVSQASRV